MAAPIPASHCDLLIRPIHGILTTMMPDGQPQSSIVWVDYDGARILINTTLERQKGRNMLANPKVSLLVIDPHDSSRWIEIRGRVLELTRRCAELHADILTQLYTGKQHFYGDIYPVEQKHKETRVIARIEPVHVALDAVFREVDRVSERKP
jgi:PPOX class probable F420-dependent enzyme